ncbi:TPA: ImmA/IrrE family metallo-endopeptidase [Pseudomonas aeruginosa]|uniref:ImmA/IrrE family metallo-endopeptidase n=1 Tax=Pseudomonas aeruginosa TaxID=287 RepID=UPI000E315812|nr:ImmA/IrrE family metallo-endopeptidase [Pseudomonas aeruginosa]EKY0776380.1 ImmA/IrrE family metallo-endopeptidase [Pseudomonas aeruginosa]ELO1026041.1 ImmA/IrrE family metallo-endopeptidase [Pseudomonas aeruginosa]MBG4188295.1 ImmA/IrrE family metallo-endopeptidase [Pseudomonas aeruginosa]MBI8716605.1 ImmA/IrrE family metallo-endopeptidase [Pseudomonas aeruginosa]MCO3718721.1 ImmA/IrrE family metallo-endopeptidase [Pseudomonas aeruginosa]
MRVSREWTLITEEQRSTISKYQAQLPVAVGAIAKEFGIKVLKSTMPGSISGEIRETENGITIKVNRHDVKERQRFTIAHEIAHYLLHRDRLAGGITDDVLYRSRLSDELEWEANRLAADIIMPVNLIQQCLRENMTAKPDDRYKIAADKAEVSLAAIKIRIGK